MQTKRVRLAGNRAFRGRKHDFRLRRAAKRERERLHGLRHEPVERVGPAPEGNLDQPGLPKDFEMVRDRRLREAERVELADAGVALARQTIDDRQTRRIGERFEPRREVLELLRLERWRTRRAAGYRGDLLH